MSKLLVTGGAGFIGANFIHYWLKNHPQDSIHNLDALTYAGNKATLKTIQDNPNYTFFEGNIRDPEAVAKAAQGVDVIVHFAAESHVDRSIIGPEAFVDTNIKGTFVLLEYARANHIHLHHISTDEVFGSLPLGSSDKFTEATPYDPRSPYSASKAASDHLVRAYGETYNLPYTITNCSNNYGPYQYPEKFIPRMITNLIEGDTIKVYGDGLYVRDWLHVEDHCRAIEAILNQGKVGETYLVGGLTCDISNLDVAHAVLDAMQQPSDKIEFVTDRPGHDRRYAVDSSKLRRDLHWEPRYDFSTWLKQTVTWYQQNEDWWKPLKKAAETIY